MPEESLKQLQNYIDGHFVSGVREFADLNPADGSTIATVCEAGPEQVDEAVHAARRAVDGAWGSTNVRDRAAMLYKVADLIESRFDCFLQAEVADTGKPISLARRLDVPRAAANFRVFADIIKTAGLEAFETDTPDGARALNYTVRKPIGVVGIVTPWNLPLLKPSEETPATATLLAEVMHDAQLPSGTFNLVHGFGPNSTG